MISTLRKFYRFIVRKFNEMFGYSETETLHEDHELQPSTSLINKDGTLSSDGLAAARDISRLDAQRDDTKNPLNTVFEPHWHAPSAVLCWVYSSNNARVQFIIMQNDESTSNKENYSMNTTESTHPVPVKSQSLRENSAATKPANTESCEPKPASTDCGLSPQDNAVIDAVLRSVEREPLIMEKLQNYLKHSNNSNTR